MPLQNRVTPFSTIEATSHRGLFMGNRGCLHDSSKQLISTRWRHQNWIICELAYKGQCRPLMTPNRYTELFFLDEAVALAAGHRPCGRCRRAAFSEYLSAWQRATGVCPSAKEVDALLHGQRVAQICDNDFQDAHVDSLPTGTFVTREADRQQAWLIVGGSLRPWSHAGYGVAERIVPGEVVQAITPPAQVSVLRHGYQAELHVSASA